MVVACMMGLEAAIPSDYVQNLFTCKPNFCRVFL